MSGTIDVGSRVQAKPQFSKNKLGKIVENYFDWLPRDVTHRITKIRVVAFGLLVKTDRLNVWVNQNCFQLVQD